MNEHINSALEVSTQTAADIAVVTREQTEIQSAIISAKKFPRNEDASFLKAVKTFSRVTMAESATYAFPRGGQKVTGPSVDCARALAQAWGNIRYGLRIVDQDSETVHIRGYALDTETNSYVEAEDKFHKKVQRRVNGPQGQVTKWIEPDERDLRELIFRRGAILVRNCILQILPPDLVEKVLLVAKDTLEKAAKNQLSESREDVVKRLVIVFDRVGVTVAMLEQRLGHKLAEVSAQEVAELDQIAKSLKDGAAHREEFFSFSDAQPQSTTESMKAKLRGNKAGQSEGGDK